MVSASINVVVALIALHRETAELKEQANAELPRGVCTKEFICYDSSFAASAGSATAPVSKRPSTSRGSATRQ